MTAARQRWADVPTLRFEMAAAEALPFRDASFDGVFMNEAPEHVDNGGVSFDENAARPSTRWRLGLDVSESVLHKINMPIPLLPWLPGIISRHMMRARNCWPWELRPIVQEHGLRVTCVESVFPVFETYPWLPKRLQRWYWQNLRRIERAPVLKAFGVSAVAIARKIA